MDFIVLKDTPSQLVIVTTTSFDDIILWITIAVSVIAGVSLYIWARRHGWGTGKALALSCIGWCLCLPGLIGAAFTHKMSLSRDTETAVFITRFAGMAIGRQQYPLSHLQSCVLEFNRGIPRLAIVMSNGLTTHPLGTNFDPKIGTYQAQTKINHFLGSPDSF